MMDNHCSPKNSMNQYTCFTNNSLIRMAEAYNKENTKKIDIPFKDDLVKNSNLRKKLWNDISIAMNRETSCDNDFCILENNILKNMNDTEILNETFRPEKPKSWNDNKWQWLSTLDILAVMKQYEKSNSDFFFVGAVPIDFNRKLGFGLCISNELCNLSLKRLLNKKIKKLGIVFNFDPHDKSGSHWVSMFSDFNTGGIYYFDSYGYKPKKEIYELMEKIRTQGNDLIIKNELDINEQHQKHLNFKLIDDKTIEVEDGTDFFKGDIVFFKKNNDKTSQIQGYNIVKEIQNNKLVLKKEIKCKDCDIILHKCFKNFYNKNRFQFKTSECGVYSMHFIEQFLNGKNFQEITDDVISDDNINKKRDFYYRPNYQSD